MLKRLQMSIWQMQAFISESRAKTDSPRTKPLRSERAAYIDRTKYMDRKE